MLLHDNNLIYKGLLRDSCYSICWDKRVSSIPLNLEGSSPKAAQATPKGFQRDVSMAKVTPKSGQWICLLKSKTCLPLQFVFDCNTCVTTDQKHASSHRSLLHPVRIVLEGNLQQLRTIFCISSSHNFLTQFVPMSFNLVPTLHKTQAPGFQCP